MAVGVLMLNAVGATFADTKTNNNKQTSQLVALLPASDAVMTFDSRRFLTDALPQILSANQPVLSGILGKIDEMKAKSGIDLRQFEQVAVGVTAVRVRNNEYDFEPVALARGQINAGALVALAKLGAKGKYREEKIGDKTIYIFDVKQAVEQNKAQDPNAKKVDNPEKMLGSLSREIALTTLDANTLAIGTTARVRQTVEGKTHVGADLTGLLYKKQTALMNVAAKVPGGVGSFLPRDNDELGKNIDAIQYIYGAMDISGANTSIQMTAKTRQDAQAKSLLETLEDLQIVGKAFLGNAKGADKQVYARMVENVKFTRELNEVSFSLDIPQSDIDLIIGAKK